MKNFTFYEVDKASLHIDDCDWLENIGLRETLWIIDALWFLTQSNNMIFKEWIGEE